MLSWHNRFEIKKDKWVYEPTDVARNEGYSILEAVKCKWTPPEYFYHFQDGGHVSAIKIHLNHHYFCKLDVKDFFSSVSRSRVTRTLKEFFPYETARRFAKISTVKHLINNQHSHSLPLGFVQSPLLATLCLNKSSFGACIDACSTKEGIEISVYMDDIILSSDSIELLDTWYQKLKESAISSKFNLNEKKEVKQALQITAFNIDISFNQMTITQQRFMELLNLYRNSQSEPQRNGIGGYVGSVNKVQATLLKGNTP